MNAGKCQWRPIVVGVAGLAALIVTAGNSELWVDLGPSELNAIIGAACYVDGSQNCPGASETCADTECDHPGPGQYSCPGGIDEEQVQKSYVAVAESPNDPGEDDLKNLGEIHCLREKDCQSGLNGCIYAGSPGQGGHYVCKPGSGDWTQTSARMRTEPDGDPCNQE